MATNEDIIGRDEINDIDAILCVVNHDSTTTRHAVKDNARRAVHVGLHARPPAAAQAVREGQGRPVERHDRPAVAHRGRPGEGRHREPGGHRHRHGPDVYIGTPVEKWGDKEWLEFGVQQQNWTLSQFLHGEQGALFCTAKIVETVPWYDAKLYASHPGRRRGPPRRGVRPLPRREAVAATTRSTPTSACCSTTSSTTAAGT